MVPARAPLMLHPCERRERRERREAVSLGAARPKPLTELLPLRGLCMALVPTSTIQVDSHRETDQLLGYTIYGPILSKKGIVRSVPCIRVPGHV